MKHLKNWKVFENIYIPSKTDKIQKYLDELDIAFDKMNDVFREMLDLDYQSYLQLFYIDKSRSRWSEIPRTTHVDSFTPYLSISFEKEDEYEEKNNKCMNTNGNVIYYENTDSLEAFTNSLFMLKSMFPDREIYWRYAPKSSEVCIYFDKILDDEE